MWKRTESWCSIRLPVTPHSLFLLLLCGLLWSTEARNVLAEEMDKESKPLFDVDGEGEADWKIYRPEHFYKNELCAVLKCNKGELCMVQSNNANCITKSDVAALKAKVAKIIEISADPNLRDDGEHEGHRRHIKQKFEQYAETLRKKQGKKKLSNEAGGDGDDSGKSKYLQMPEKVHRDSENACTQQQLVAIEARLLAWFSELRAQSTAPEPAVLPKHNIACNQDAIWMFAKLDGNSNEAITLEELSKLERRGSKDCIEPFLDRCDLNNDQKLSLDEWCDCFKWAGKEKEEPPCHSARRLHDPHILGAFTPECDVDGFYKFKQCHEGFCWCVDKWGREFDQSRVRGQPDCGQYGKY